PVDRILSEAACEAAFFWPWSDVHCWLQGTCPLWTSSLEPVHGGSNMDRPAGRRSHQGRSAVTWKQTTSAKDDRISRELLEAAADLSRHGLMSQEDMLQVRALCEPPPVYAAKKVADIRTRQVRMSQSVFAE